MEGVPTPGAGADAGPACAYRTTAHLLDLLVGSAILVAVSGLALLRLLLGTHHQAGPPLRLPPGADARDLGRL